MLLRKYYSLQWSEDLQVRVFFFQRSEMLSYVDTVVGAPLSDQ